MQLGMKFWNLLVEVGLSLYQPELSYVQAVAVALILISFLISYFSSP